MPNLPWRQRAPWVLLLVLALARGAVAQEAPGVCIDELDVQSDHDARIVTLSWRALDRATTYHVARAQDGGDSEVVAILPATQTTFVDDPAPEGVLDYRVAADGPPALECFAASVHIGGQPPDPDVPLCVGDLSAEALPDGSIRLSWPAITGATSYDILRARLDDELRPLALVPADQTSFVDATAEPGVPFRYSVNANGLVPPGVRCEEVTAVAVPEFPHVAVAIGAGAAAALGIVLVRRRRS